MKYLDNEVIAVLIVKTLDGLKKKVSQLESDGYKVLEVTLRTEYAFEAIKIIKESHPNLKVGAGTILSLQQLQQSISCGADFGVAPGLNAEVVQQAQAQNFDFIPGIATATELEQAMALGIKLVKVFPAKFCGGVEFIKALSGPYSKMKFMPTGGITKETSTDYLSLPTVKCVGGSWMNNS
jgi:2-dehydro-3-deoxyphosphogluconate aldolase/(4S)-4-hydroxy-2-oxoglutarate aldolase